MWPIDGQHQTDSKAFIMNCPFPYASALGKESTRNTFVLCAPFFALILWFQSIWTCQKPKMIMRQRESSPSCVCFVQHGCCRRDAFISLYHVTSSVQDTKTNLLFVPMTWPMVWHSIANACSIWRVRRYTRFLATARIYLTINRRTHRWLKKCRTKWTFINVNPMEVLG